MLKVNAHLDVEITENENAEYYEASAIDFVKAFNHPSVVTRSDVVNLLNERGFYANYNSVASRETYYRKRGVRLKRMQLSKKRLDVNALNRL